MTSREYAIVKILADGKRHSGQELADKVGVSRTAIWKHLNNIRDKRIEVHAVKGKGYQFSEPLELLEADRIIKSLIELSGNDEIAKIDVFYSLGSTNQYLLDKLTTGSIHNRVVLSEHQANGRGRSNNRWESGLGAGIYLSIGWHYSLMPNAFPALSLAVGTVVSNCISELTGKSIGLKWPNDLVYSGSKLGGILIESRGQHAGTMDVVVGLGLNVRVYDSIRKSITQEITDLKSMSGNLLSRNELAASIISNILKLLMDYPQRGFNYYLSDWRMKDVAREKKARLEMDKTLVEGTVVDVDEEGNLIMNVNGAQEKFTSGNLSLRFEN